MICHFESADGIRLGILSQLVAFDRSPQMFSSTLQVLADQSPGFEGFSAPREALGKGVPVPQGRIERQSGVPRDEGDVGFIRIRERERERERDRAIFLFLPFCSA